MIKTVGYAAKTSFSSLAPYAIERAEPGPHDVLIDILYCGVCHSDVHQVKNEWHNTVYPCMPGHEIIGRVVKAGDAVQEFRVGDLAGVGCMVNSCGECPACQQGLEQYCEPGALATYNGNMRHPSKENLTFGGYSKSITVPESFALRIPENLDIAGAAPLLCAGVTTYSALRAAKIGVGTRVGIIGFGGLGHVAVKLAAAMGATVSVITTSAGKADDARRAGAADVIVSTDTAQMKAHEKAFDFILSTIPEEHDVNDYTPLLARDGTLTIVGCLMPLTKPVDMSKMIMDRRTLSTSLIGGISETQEVLDFCGANNITANVKVIPIDKVNEAFEAVDKGEVDFRYVIDMATLDEKKALEDSKSLLEKVGIGH